MAATFNDKVKTVIKANPGVQLESLMQQFSCDAVDLKKMLDEPVRRGEINSELVTSESGLKTYSYRMNPAYVGWGAPGQMNQPAGAAPVDQKSKVQKAVDYLQANGSATSSELSIAMGLDTTRYTAAQFLGNAIKRGAIARDGNRYITGTGIAATPSTTRGKKEGSTTASQPIAVPSFVAAKSVKPAHIPQDSVASSMCVGGLQILAWERSGHLVISANDNTVDLAPGHVRALRAFIGLIGVADGQA